MKILITGPQGSGKTTHAKLISEDLKIPVIDAGNMLRELAKKNTSDGIKVQESMKTGTLAPDEIVGRMVKDRVSQDDCRNGYVMDGYPRSLPQIKVFEPGYTHVYYLDISDQEATQRLLRRGRADDNPELIAKRLSLYHQNTEPVLAYFEKLGILTKVDGSGSIEEVNAKIKNSLHG